jgi:hypothetical protein
MNTTKLTLSISEEVIEKAKRYAKKKGTSISYIVESWLKKLADEEESQKKISPDITALKGIISLPESYNYKDNLGDLFIK